MIKHTESQHIGREDYEERQARRKAGLERAAEKAQKAASDAYGVTKEIVEMLPMGQPILYDHHSAPRHRKLLEKMDRKMRESINQTERANDLASRAAAVGTAGISSDDPQAIEKLQQKIADAEHSQAVMKAANAAIRKTKGKGDDARLAALIAAGLTEEQARDAMTPDCFGGIGFASYALSNNNANINRMKVRLVQLVREAEAPTGEIERTECGVVHQVADNRVQVVFPGKPNREMCQFMRAHGFRWAPSAGAWQRHQNSAGRFHAHLVIEAIKAGREWQG